MSMRGRREGCECVGWKGGGEREGGIGKGGVLGFCGGEGERERDKLGRGYCVFFVSYAKGTEELTASLGRVIVGKAVHDDGEDGPAQQNVVGEETDGTEPEGTVADVVAAAHKEGDDGDRIRDVEEDDAGGDHSVDMGMN